jgi:SAM-dependent methyltransferase
MHRTISLRGSKIAAARPVQRILDFGAGFRWQANLFYGLDMSRLYVAIDAIPFSYTLQHRYLASLDPDITDNVVDPERFRLGDSGIHHLPTWRHDLLPDNHFDLAPAVQVLPELSERLATFAVQLIYRVLAPGGRLYVRDHAEAGTGPNCVDYRPILLATGYQLDWRLDAKDGVDIHGLPRVYLKPLRQIAE